MLEGWWQHRCINEGIHLADIEKVAINQGIQWADIPSMDVFTSSVPFDVRKISY